LVTVYMCSDGRCVVVSWPRTDPESIATVIPLSIKIARKVGGGLGWKGIERRRDSDIDKIEYLRRHGTILNLFSSVIV
jgi:hypothetical protein